MAASAVLLAGDIGGTKTKLALFHWDDNLLRPSREQTYPSADYSGLEQILSEFLKNYEVTPQAACFGVAGPVVEGRCLTTNLPWVIDETALIKHTAIPQVKLLNDLQAMALGLAKLPGNELVELNPSANPRPGNIAVLAAGTGLGEAILFWDGNRHHASATEGGHTDFAPNTEQQDALLKYLRQKFQGHVSYERILSGSGLFDLYGFLAATGYAPETAEFQAALAAGEDGGRLVSLFAETKADQLSQEALRLFMSIYGAEAGNLALKCGANGGVLIGGGIAAKNLAAMQRGEFFENFCQKGRFSGWAATLSVKVALNQDAGLLGSAHHAASLLN